MSEMLERERRIWWASPYTLVILMIMTLLTAGCSTRIADMTVITTRIVALDRVDLDKLPTKRRVAGESTRWTILIIPLGFPTIKEAVDDALDKGGGDLMTDAVVTSEGWTAILFGLTRLKVEGDVVKTRN
ncbi:MAG: hypothetical protein P0120_05030 [Nitrospira sp.]|nr:hypothetical protein [Nitrospira sp.]